MSLNSVNNQIRLAKSDGVVTAEEMRAIIQTAAQEGGFNARETNRINEFIRNNTAANILSSEAKGIAAEFIAYGRLPADPKLSPAAALQTILENFARFDTALYGSGADGLIGLGDLRAILETSVDPKLRAAAQFAIQNFGQLAAGGNNGLISYDELRAWIPVAVAGGLGGVPGGVPGGGGGGGGTGDVTNTPPQVGDDLLYVPYPENQDASSDYDAQIAAVLADPSLSIEDQVVLVLMLIMKALDKDIENQTKHIQELQKQQNKDGSNTSIDVETMKLKRLIDKRSQLFDTLRQIIDKYNQTAKSLIDTIGR